jgi:hypothetical protein
LLIHLGAIRRVIMAISDARVAMAKLSQGAGER